MLSPFGFLDKRPFIFSAFFALVVIMVSAFLRLYGTQNYQLYYQILGGIGFYLAFCTFYRRFHSVGKSAWSILAIFTSCFIVSVLIMILVSVFYGSFDPEIYNRTEDIKNLGMKLSRPMRFSMIIANLFVYLAFVFWLARLKNQTIDDLSHP